MFRPRTGSEQWVTLCGGNMPRKTSPKSGVNSQFQAKTSKFMHRNIYVHCVPLRCLLLHLWHIKALPNAPAAVAALYTGWSGPSTAEINTHNLSTVQLIHACRCLLFVVFIKCDYALNRRLASLCVFVCCVLYDCHKFTASMMKTILDYLYLLFDHAARSVPSQESLGC